MTGTIWVVSILLFLSGLAAVVVRRQLLAMLLGLELMICAVNVILVHYSGLFGDPAGLAAVLLIMAVAAAEAVTGLCLILRMGRLGKAPETTALSELRG